MHNCKATKESLMDLVFDEASPLERSRLMAEIAHCANCYAEHASLCEVLRVVDLAGKSALPSGSFWPAYHTRLSQQIRGSADGLAASFLPSQKNLKPAPLNAMRTAMVATLRVPVPVAAAFVLLLSVSSLLAVRSRRPLMIATPAPSALVETRTVEVPVIQERVLTRVVYVEKTRRRLRGAATQSEQRLLDTTAGLQKEASEKKPASLAGFKPAEEVKLTIIKGSYRDEK